MTTADQTSELVFEPPGPGPWELEAVHFPRPVTRYWSEWHPEAIRRGFQEFTGYYGMMLDRLEYAYINGFAYQAAVPIAPEQAPERFQRAEQVFRDRLWREQLKEWDETFKPASIARHRELQGVDPDALSDTELSAYLERCHEHHREMVYQHMRFTGAAMVAIGDLLAHAVDWTGLSHVELLGMMRGSAPVSAGASGELAAMVQEMRADPDARAILDSDADAGQTLERLRRLDTPAGRAVNDYLNLTGYRLLDGFDISGRYALEMPDALLRAIRIQVDGTGEEDTAAEAEAKIAEVRAEVPEEHREAFDGMVDEARVMYRIRDERGVYSDIWASGIMRRAALGAGRRLAEHGRIHDPEHIVDATVAEMQALVLGTGGPSADELAARRMMPEAQMSL